MESIFKEFLDWSEVWAVLIPFIVYIIKKPRQKFLKPVFIYLCVALFLNVLIDLVWKGKHYYEAEFKEYIPRFFWSNNFIYNIHSACRLFLFLWFFEKLNFHPTKLKNSIVVLISFGLIIINFSFYQSFKNFSNTLFAFEGIILLIYSLSYFLYIIKKDEVNTAFNPSLFIVTGLALYEAVSFSIFLFHDALTVQNPGFSIAIWKVHDYVFIVLCLFFAKAFYGERKPVMPVYE